MPSAIQNFDPEPDHEPPRPAENRAHALSRHVPALDGIRGLAILMVTAYRFNIGPDYDILYYLAACCSEYCAAATCASICSSCCPDS